MNRWFHNLALPLALVAAISLIIAPTVAEADDWRDHLDDWERLEHQRSSLMQQVDELEAEHQKFVDDIEKLKDQRERGDASRSDLEDKLRKNHRTVEALEQLQRQMRDLDTEQARLRSRILDDIDTRRRALEDELREADDDERRRLVAELNELQQRRSDYSMPLPETDRKRVEQALADARKVSDGGPREMMAVADELEDTEQQLTERLEALDDQIRQLEQARAIHRQSRQFGEFDTFFDETDRRRTIADREQAVQSGDDGDDDDGGDVDLPPSRLNPAEEHQQDEQHGDVDEGMGAGDDYDPGDAPDDGSDSAHGDPVDDTDNFDHYDETGQEDDPFGTDTESVVIESETDPETGEDSPYFSERAIEHDLELLEQERESLRKQAEELRQKADELRRDAERPD